MNYILHLLVFITIFLNSSFTTSALETEWDKSEVSEVRIISPLSNNNNQEEIILGLEYKMKPGWKTYWKSPGDGGFPQEVNWKNSININSLEIKWPIPTEFEILGFKSLGYENNIIFPIKISIKDISKTTYVNLIINYLVCEKICIPGYAELFLEIPAGEGTVTNNLHTIEKAISSLPLNDINLTSLNAIDVKVLKSKEKILFKVNVSSKKNFEDPKLFIHTPFGLPVKNTFIEYSSNNKQISTKTYFSEDLFVKKSFDLELVLIDNNFNYKFLEKIKIQQTNKINFLNNVILFYIFSAFIGGLILNFMPCVFPVLSIKIISLLNLQEEKTRFSFLITSIGIILSFILLGLFFLILKNFNIAISWGMQFQEPYFLMLMIVIISLFMLSMFDLFQIQLPSYIMNLFLFNEKGKNYKKDFFTGFFATLMATPCSAPFVGTAITAAFTQSSLILILIFIFMGIGMSTPYLVISAFPKIALFLPKPGKWMVYLKYFLGLLLFFTILWLLNILYNYFNLYFISISLFLLFISFFILKLKSNLIFFNIVILFIFFSLPSFNFFKQNTENFFEKNWTDFFSVDYNNLIANNEIVFLDITADWCATCQYNKINVLNTSEIKNFFLENNIVLLKADWTKPDERINAFLIKKNKYGIPFNAFFSNKFPEGIILSELLSKKEIKEVFDKL